MSISAVEFNIHEIAAGRITAEHLHAFTDMNEFTAKVRAYQEAVPELGADGKLGKKTRAWMAKPDAAVVELLGPVYQPLVGGCWWSGNAFVPGKHDGCDGFSGPKGDGGWPDSGDTTVCAICNGTVRKIHQQKNGFWVLIQHNPSLLTLSGHLIDKGSVEKGSEVVAGDPLGALSADVNPPHIHFQAWVHGELVDPADLLKGLGAGIWME